MFCFDCQSRAVPTSVFRWTSWICSLVGLAGSVCGATGPVDLEFFEKRIRPILASECYECHGAEKQEAGLRLDFRQGILDGGDSGPAVIAGEPKRSLLLSSMRHPDASQRMPKNRAAVPPDALADFEKWILEGAPDPRDTAPAAGEVSAADWEAVFEVRRQWWSFQPLAMPPVPAAGSAVRFSHPVDRFLAEKLDAAGLEPAPRADRRTLLRRLSFILNGVPPKPEDLETFLADDSPEAFAQVVDRLLAAPEFGERWARHWMDLTRFAETHGSEGDPAIPHAYQYRDYLIRALNADVSWDQLIREHIAGDLLPNPRINEAEGINESMIGPAQFRLVEHGFQPVDTLDEQVKTIDNQIDVVSKAFQGLTISCSRCHDHKFDPISHRDYYSLYGILASSRPGHVAIDLPERLQVHRGELGRLKEEIRKGLAAAWTAGAADLREVLISAPSAGPLRPLPIDEEIGSRIEELQRQILEIEAAARLAALGQRHSAEISAAGVEAAPVAVWTFDADASDALGDLDGELHHGAVIRDGRLVLDGKGAFLSTPPLTATLGEKTLEAWVSIADLGQTGGGVVTVESRDGRVFDSIVFAERAKRQWMSGSDNGGRSQPVGGPEESAKPDELVHLAIVYGADQRIAIFRNGEAYGSDYRAPALQAFEAGSARVLLGMRHTGGGNPFFRGGIEEARLYDKALSREQIAHSFQQGPGWVSAEQLAAALAPEQRQLLASHRAEIATLEAELARKYPDHAQRKAAGVRLARAVHAAAGDPEGALHHWHRLRGLSGAALAAAWNEFSGSSVAASEPGEFTPFWEIGKEGADSWFALGVNPPAIINQPGSFAVEAEGDEVMGGLLPAGVFSHLLSARHHGIFQSPEFEITTDSISVLVVGGKGARVRVIPDNYPLGGGNIFPQATLDSDRPTWVRLDSAYRKGSRAYIEFVTADDSLSRDRTAAGPDGRSFFGVSKVVFHDGPPPRSMRIPPAELLPNLPAQATAEEFATHLCGLLEGAIAAWENDTLGAEQFALLDSFIRAGLLPTSLIELPGVAPLVADYRRLEQEIPLPRRAPGLLETVAKDSPLLLRGDHKLPQDLIPRGYISIFSDQPYETKQSGRLELAEEITGAGNPLTSRVMVNRIWQHLFGRGLVPTVDNFGRLGEFPTHPELLDFLANRLVENQWSAKEMIRFLVVSEAWQRESSPSPEAREIDPSNIWLSHARVRRLEAEAVRDSMLAISGRLSDERFGPGANALAAPPEQRRRSVYLTIRRNFLSPFLEVFDAPRPFTTLGQRDSTNVPGQSLALLNDPFVIDQAKRWAELLLEVDEPPDARVARMFETAIGRGPGAAESAAVAAYLADLTTAHGTIHSADVWRDLAQSIFNLKEFIYLR
jgi:hypothetical protein